MDKMMTPIISGKEGLSIITCTGDWSQVQQTYLSRQFLRATIVEENTNYQTTEIKNELKEQREKAAENSEKAENTEN